MADARAIMADYPDLRAAVQDVAAVQRERRSSNVQVDLSLRGPDMDEAAASTPSEIADVDAGARRTSSTWTRACRCRKPGAAGAASTASGRPTWACRSQAIATTLQRAGRRRAGDASTRRATSSTTSGCGPSCRAATGPTAIAVLTVPATRRQAGRAAERRHARRRRAARPRSTGSAGSGRWRARANLGHGRGARRRAAGGRRATSKELDLPPEYRYEFLGEAKMLAESNTNFADRVRAGVRVHVHDPGGAVREPRPPDHDPAGACR